MHPVHERLAGDRGAFAPLPTEFVDLLLDLLDALDVAFEFRPRIEAVLAGDDKLCLGEWQGVVAKMEMVFTILWS